MLGFLPAHAGGDKRGLAAGRAWWQAHGFGHGLTGTRPGRLTMVWGRKLFCHEQEERDRDEL